MKKILLVLLLFATTATAKDISLIWDPSPTTDVAGYNLHYSCGEDVRPFPNILDVGKVLTYTLNDFDDNVGCYFAVTAYNSVGQESDYSNVVYSPAFAPPEPPLNLRGTTTVNNVDVPL